MFDPQPRTPAPDLTPDEYMTWLVFEHNGVDTFQEAEADA